MKATFCAPRVVSSNLKKLIFTGFSVFSISCLFAQKYDLPKHISDRGIKSYEEYYHLREQQVNHEHDMAARLSSVNAFNEIMEDVFKIANVKEDDKAGFKEMLRERYLYKERFEMNNKILNGEINEQNIYAFKALKTKELASFYSSMYIKGQTSFYPDINTVKSNIDPLAVLDGAKQGGNTPFSLACNNEDFETTSAATVPGWNGRFGISGAVLNCGATTPNPMPTAGFNMGAINSGLNQHTFMTAGNDPVGGAALPVVSNLGGGGGASFRLGDLNDGCEGAELTKTFLVTSANTNFSYDYAVVMYDGHPASTAPKFTITMTDQAGNNIGCAAYTIDATQAANPANGYIQSGTFGLYYKPWSRVFVPLTAYLGQNVTIRFQVSDCNGYAHRGYAYLECTCAPFQLISSSPVICGNTNTTLTAPAGAASYSWTVLGGGGNIVSGANSQVVTVNQAGQYQVTMTAFGSGCSYTIDTTIAGGTVSPTANFTTTTVCAGVATNFTDQSNGNGVGITSWNWSFGSGGATSTNQNPSYTYPTPGLYTTTLTVNNGCADTYTANVNVIAQPTAAFTAPAVCQNAVTNFTNNSVNGTTYAWNFGDPGSGANNTSALQTPGHTFSTSGNFVVTLTVTAAGGCSSNTTQNITVNANPVPNFSSTSVCQGTATTFNNLTPGVPAIANWAWDFDNNATTDNTTQTPNNTYAAAGNFTSVLTVTTTAGCTGTFNAPVVVYPNPTALFTAPNVCDQQSMQFTDQSTINPNPTGDNIAQWIWGFGGQGVSNLQNPSFTFNGCNTYNITLTAITNHACTHTYNTNVTVYCKPVAAFTAPAVCFGTNTTLTNTTAGATSSDWDLDGNGTTDNTTHPILNYNMGNANTYNVSLIATNADGCKDTITQPVIVNPMPAPNFTATPVCLGNNTSFGSTSTISSGTINNYSWDFGDASALGNGANTTHSYASSNTYTVTLTTTSNNNCTASYSTTIVVHPNPVAAFISNTVCATTASQFTDQSAINPPTSGNTITNWAWDFNGDGVPDNLAQNPSFVFPGAGTFPVNLIVVTNNGCTHTINGNVTVNPNPQPSFTSVGVCQGVATTYNNTSPGNPAIQSWSWDFNNDGIQDNTTQNPNNTFPSYGTYNTVLTATTTNGCVGSFASTVDVYPLPNPNFTASDLVCLGSPTMFIDLSTVIANPGANQVTNWAWDFDNNGTSDNASQNPSYTMPNPGSSAITLTVTTNHNCQSSITHNIYVNYIPVAAFAVDDPDGCPDHVANFSDNSAIASGSIMNWNWNFGNGAIAFGQNPPAQSFQNTSYTTSQYYNVGLTVTSDSGCTHSITIPNFIQVFPRPKADFFNSNVDPDSYWTMDPTFNFFNASIGATALTWNFGDVFQSDPTANTSNAINPSYTYVNYEPHTYNVSLLAVNNYGCADSIVKPVEIRPAWTFYIPNCFTPNGDGVNDGFRGTGINIEDYGIWIFDRWGMMIWHSENLDQFWDGRMLGKDGIVQEDVYVWKVKFKDVFGQKHEKNGTVAVIR